MGANISQLLKDHPNDLLGHALDLKRPPPNTNTSSLPPSQSASTQIPKRQKRTRAHNLVDLVDTADFVPPLRKLRIAVPPHEQLKASDGCQRRAQNGIPVTNGIANISFDKTGKVITFGSNMVRPAALPSILRHPISRALGIPHYDAVPITLWSGFHIIPPGTDPNRKWTTLTHQFQLSSMDASKWVQPYVDATNLKQRNVVQVVDFVADAAYRALELSRQDDTRDGGFTSIRNLQNLTTSSNGWHKDSDGKYTDTQGETTSSPTPSRASSPPERLKATSYLNYESNPNAPTVMNVDGARVNAFHVANKYHETLYKYRFTKAAYNFQDDDIYGKAGKGEDRVEMQVQAPRRDRANPSYRHPTAAMGVS
ncbi:hypothetical protein M407DRAFT_27263 [Tulasnella calospora MUT 4182]|uniref:Extracellular metalloproteinase n=1 Tax=Tulasnella calospora MUT 4182 TaxID=1051891 RepID=A0A0C3LPC8_9AGAM|nr:hypothetical protein M407DRAFT_27263 [Tulasnella calospora MUT 4182]